MPAGTKWESMSLQEQLEDFAGAIGRAATVAPDEYPDWSYDNYEATRTDIQDLWSQIRSLVKRDADKVLFIEDKIAEAFAAFDSGDRERGRKAMWAVYNLGLSNLR